MAKVYMCDKCNKIGEARLFAFVEVPYLVEGKQLGEEACIGTRKEEICQFCAEKMIKCFMPEYTLEKTPDRRCNKRGKKDNV